MTTLSQQKEGFDICLRLLARREYSQKELVDRLVLKGFNQNDILCVIDDLIDRGWQSDERFAESYARHRIKQGNGPIKINYELRQRGVEGFDLEPVVTELANSWFDVIRQVYEKKYTDTSTLSQKEWLKRSRFLQQRGFNQGMIRTLLDK